MTAVSNQIAVRHFGAKLVKALGKRGITFIGITSIPGDGPMACANSETGYVVSDNGTQRVCTRAGIKELAAA